jgi:formylglycine-generating enzyme required for sulfatase activity
MLRRQEGRIYDINGDHIWLELQQVDADSKIIFDTDRRVFIVEPGWENHPVVEVSWYGANAFSTFFDRRLPSEAEWEMAARGTSSDLGDSTFTIEGDSSEVISVGVGYPYPWGDEITPRHANYLSSGDPFETVLDVGTTPVGFYDGTNHGGFATQNNASPFGCFDMAGNAYEWVGDWLQNYRDPHSAPADGELKVIRGGSWRKGAGSTLTWIRNATCPDSTDNSIGFRTAGPP